MTSPYTWIACNQAVLAVVLASKSTASKMSYWFHGDQETEAGTPDAVSWGEPDDCTLTKDEFYRSVHDSHFLPFHYTSKRMRAGVPWRHGMQHITYYFYVRLAAYIHKEQSSTGKTTKKRKKKKIKTRLKKILKV